MRVDEEFDRVRTALRSEQEALSREFDRIDAEARATVDASVEHVRGELATQADRIWAAIALQREEVEARSEEFRAELENSDLDDGTAPDATPGTVPDDALPDDALSDDAEAPHLVDVDQPDGTEAEHLVDVDQPDGTGIEHQSPADDEPDHTVGDVERGD